MQGSVHSSTFVFNMSFTFEMKTVLRVKVGYDLQIVQMRILKIGGTTIQMGILHVLLNMLAISLLSMVYDTSGYILRFEEN